MHTRGRIVELRRHGWETTGKYPQGSGGGSFPSALRAGRGKATQKVPVTWKKPTRRPDQIRTVRRLGLGLGLAQVFSREACSVCPPHHERASERAWLGLAWVLAARTTSRTFRQGAQCYFADRYIHSDDLRVYICNTTVNHSLLLAWSSRTFLTSPRRSVTSSLCQFGLWPLASSASSRGGSTVGSNRYRAKSD